jgi:hypothetical protein
MYEMHPALFLETGCDINFPPYEDMPRTRKIVRKSTGPIEVPRHQLAPRHEGSSNGSNDLIGDLEAQVE